MYWIYRGAIYDLTQAPFRPGAERHETVQTRVKDPEGSARTEKTMRCKIGYNYLSVYIIDTFLRSFRLWVPRSGLRRSFCEGLHRLRGVIFVFLQRCIVLCFVSAYPGPFMPEIFQRSLFVTREPPPAEPDLQQECAKTDQQARRISAIRSQIQAEREIDERPDDRL